MCFIINVFGFCNNLIVFMLELDYLGGVLFVGFGVMFLGFFFVFKIVGIFLWEVFEFMGWKVYEFYFV